jgi:hypothetical protein
LFAYVILDPHPSAYQLQGWFFVINVAVLCGNFKKNLKYPSSSQATGNKASKDSTQINHSMAKERVNVTQKLQTSSHGDADKIPRISEKRGNNYRKVDLLLLYALSIL